MLLAVRILFLSCILQCAALDGKCSISCDNDVSVHIYSFYSFTTVFAVYNSVFMFLLFFYPLSVPPLYVGYQLLPHRQQWIHYCGRGSVFGEGHLSQVSSSLLFCILDYS